VGGGGGTDWTDLDENRERWWAFVNVVTNIPVPQNKENFLTSSLLVKKDSVSWSE
jgi:hypothetical protein